MWLNTGKFIIKSIHLQYQVLECLDSSKILKKQYLVKTLPHLFAVVPGKQAQASQRDAWITLIPVISAA